MTPASVVVLAVVRLRAGEVETAAKTRGLELPVAPRVDTAIVAEKRTAVDLLEMMEDSASAKKVVSGWFSGGVDEQMVVSGECSHLLHSWQGEKAEDHDQDILDLE